MLFFYGVGKYKSKKPPVKIYRSCSDCQGYNSLSVIPVYKYFHVFWIPLFYCGNEYILRCDSCGLYYQGNITVNKGITKNIKPPFWMFSGIIIAFLFGSFLFWNNKTAPERNRKQALEFIENPQKGDIYDVKFNEKEFGLYKVDRVVADSIYFLVNDFVVAKAYQLSQLNSGQYKENYTMEVGYPKNELKEAVSQGDMLKVNR